MMNAFLSAFNWYGFLIATGIVLGVVGAYFVAKRRGMEGDVIIDMIVICLPLAILGARIYHVVFDVLAGNEWTFAEFWGFDSGSGNFVGLSGLAIYGGLFGALIGAVIFRFWKNRKKLPENKRVSFWQIVDIGFLFIILGQAVGRWGNIANSEGYGNVITNTALQWSPFGMIGRDGLWHYSIPLYESIWDLIGFGILFWLYIGRHKSFDGFVFAAYGIYYGIGRTWIEAIRVDDVLYLGGMRVSVFVSVLFILAGVAIIVAHIVRAKKADKKIFIFVDQKKLNDDYFEYEKTKLAHPMPDIVFFKDRKKKKNGAESVVVDKNGVAIRVKAENDDVVRNDVKPEKLSDNNRTATVASEDDYEDKWDD